MHGGTGGAGGQHCKKFLGYFNHIRSPQLHSFCVCDM